MRTFEDNFFFGRTNRLSGSGGELLVKGVGNQYATRMEIGDRLIGIGITEWIEDTERSTSDFLREIGPNQLGDSKLALRAFEISNKKSRGIGYEFSLSPLKPKEYSELVELVSDGAVKISPESIPQGTLILSFIDPNTTYTLE